MRCLARSWVRSSPNRARGFFAVGSKDVAAVERVPPLIGGDRLNAGRQAVAGWQINAVRQDGLGQCLKRQPLTVAQRSIGCGCA